MRARDVQAVSAERWSGGELQRVLIALVDALRTSQGEADLLNHSLKIICEATSSNIGWLGSLDADDCFRGICLTLNPPNRMALNEKPDGIWLSALKCGEPTVIEVKSQCPPPLGVEAEVGHLDNLIIVPFSYDFPGEGFLALANSPEGYSDEVTSFVRQVVRVLETTVSHKQSEERLKEQESKFRLIADTARDAIIMIDSAGEVTYWNNAAEELFGYTADEMMGQELHVVVAPKHLHSAYIEGFQRFQETGTGPAIGKTLELPAIRKDGSEVTIELSLAAAQSHDGWHAIGVVRDISERKKAEASLQESEQRFRAIFEDSADGIVIGDLETLKFTMVNKKILRMLGYESSQIQHLCFEDIWAESWKDKMKKLFESLPSEGAHTISDCEVRRKDGRSFHADLVVSLLSLSGRPHFMAIIRDITERKALEYQMAQMQKLQSIGQLAAGIAHEINTPMQYIGDNTLFLKDAFGDISRALNALRSGKTSSGQDVQRASSPCDAFENMDVDFISEEIPKAIDQILEGVERVTQIVKAMKDFSHPDDKVASPFDVNKAIQSTVTIARNEWKYVADCELDLDPNIPPVHGFQGEFNQAILNMVVNAAHAIAQVVGDGSNGKGKIMITTRRDGNWVEVRIKDTGCGIPKDIRNRIFDPFFTTKEIGKGTGQGLTIAHSVIVEKHKGTLTFETEEGKGTTFVIRLPIKRDA